MEIKSNASAVIDKILFQLSAPNVEKLVATVSQNIYALSANRVFNEGKNVNGYSMWRYSTKPLYVNPHKSPKSFPVAGKNSTKQKFNNGETRKTRYFSGGYKDFRNKIGRRIDVVDLQLTGTLKANYQLVKSSNGYEVGFLSSKQAKIARRHEERFGAKIFGLSKKDAQITANIVENFIKNINGK